MTKVVITGANGFIGKNLSAHLLFREDIQLEKITREDNEADLQRKLKDADVIFHLAGANRPLEIAEFNIVNVTFTEKILKIAGLQPKPCKIIMSSSTQATQDNPYGNSKREAEIVAEKWVKETPHQVIVYRLPGVFGKWSKPNYNSVVSTFCYNVAHNIGLEVRDPEYLLSLVYVDDIVANFNTNIAQPTNGSTYQLAEVSNVFNIKLGALADLIKSFKTSRTELVSPAVGQHHVKALYSTYLSYLPENEFSYPMDLKTDNRGSLFEWIKHPEFGQIFVSTTKPGITRGNHFHHTKTEKFLVIKGTGIIRFRKIDDTKIVEYLVNGNEPTVVDIPPGYTHNITNTGESEMITLFWSNEIFDKEKPDTQFLEI